MNGLNRIATRKSENVLANIVMDQLRAFDAAIERNYLKVYAFAIVFFAVIVPVFAVWLAATFGHIAEVCQVTSVALIGSGMFLLGVALSDERLKQPNAQPQKK